MSDVIVYYKHGRYANIAKQLADFLLQEGHWVTFDETAEPVGQPIEPAKKERIRGADFVIVVFTPDFFEGYFDASPRPWRKMELDASFENEKQLIGNSPGDYFIIPVVVTEDQHDWRPAVLEKYADQPECELISERTSRSRGLIKIAIKSNESRVANIEDFRKILPSIDLLSPKLRPSGGKTWNDYVAFLEQYKNENLTFTIHDKHVNEPMVPEYTKSKDKLNSWTHRFNDNPIEFVRFFEPRFKAMKQEHKDDPEILEVDNARRRIYRAWFNVCEAILKRQVPIPFIRANWGGPTDIRLWANICFPLQMALDRVFGGAKEPFILYFGIFYPGNEELFDTRSGFREFFEDPKYREMKEAINRAIRFRLLRPTVAEQAKLRLDVPL